MLMRLWPSVVRVLGACLQKTAERAEPSRTGLTSDSPRSSPERAAVTRADENGHLSLLDGRLLEHLRPSSDVDFDTIVQIIG